jgi:1-acyl-sn-glycerol-3-phosphate acyltransferase
MAEPDSLGAVSRPAGLQAESRPLQGLALLVAAARSVAAYLAISIYLLVVGPPGLLLAMLLKSGDIVHVLGHGGVWLGLRIAGIRCRLEGGEHLLRDRAAVYCANHESNVDPPALYHILHPRLHVLYKAEMSRLPILGRAMALAGFVPIDRGNREQATRALDHGAELLANGASFLIFPEGTRSRTGELLSFNKGGFRMAIKAQAPVVPVAVSGGRAAMAKGSFVIRPTIVRVRVGEPVETAGSAIENRDRIIAEVRTRIERLLQQQAAGSRQIS